ncbi:MAG: M42 family metallopeptidase [Bacilli bacterium]|jgi:putative aminopeptidase FrvX|nr:M42 family metallopeptidase [Bacilli bacterium]MDD3348528.1 M42 family metallopeptidase [Bacilli bacterium]MDD4056832.1 M42 family metallopeptidase [Bacilli bacterium]MDY0208825.1 M42 family metallopeptidase [Bacilli bacterium]
MKSINQEKLLKFTKDILNIPSPSGYTKIAIDFLKEEAKKRNLTHEVLKNGNLIITIKGKNQNITGFSAHVDTLGAMVRSITSKGELKFSVLGGPILPTYDGEYCYIITRDGKKFTGTFLSSAPSVHVYKDSRTLPRDDTNMFIRLDEKVHNKEDVTNLGIGNGDFIVLDPKTVITPSGFIKSRFLDDKISVAILFGLIDYLQENNIQPQNTLKFIFSTNEEVGFGASYIPEVDELIAVDMGCIGEDLSCTEYDVSICAKDTSGPYNLDLTNNLIFLAKNAKLSYVVDIYPFYSSDVSAALKAGNNIKGALVGPGVHASHGMERTHIDGVLNTLKLLIELIEKN